DPEPIRRLQRLRASVAVGLRHTREARDDRALHARRDLADGLPLALGGHGKAGLDDVHAEPRQLLRDLDLLRAGQRDAGRLLPVAERRVEDPNYVAVTHRGFLPSATASSNGAPDRLPRSTACGPARAAPRTAGSRRAPPAPTPSRTPRCGSRRGSAA